MTTTNFETITVIGGAGFVGRSIVTALEQKGLNVKIVHAPRLTLRDGMQQSCLPPEAFGAETVTLSQHLIGSLVVINAAGNPDASSHDLGLLLGPNAALPVLISRASDLAKVKRFIHVSSAAVQGNHAVLDNSFNLFPFSPYSQSKAFGEVWLLSEQQKTTEVTIYRPPGVHGVNRTVTERIRTLASSPFSSVAGTGSSKTPQALLENVGDAIAFLATTCEMPRQIVHHPWEGLSSADLLRCLGNREPHHLPHWLARSLINCVKLAERPLRFIAPNRRRLELLWFGQGVAPSWLEQQGWVPPLNRDRWFELGKPASKR